MKKIFLIFISIVVGLSFVTTTSMASSSKGQKLYLKKLKKSCKMTGGEFALKHTQQEWTDIYSDLIKTPSEASQVSQKINNTISKTSIVNQEIFYGTKSERFLNEIKTICPDSKKIKEKYVVHLYDFFYSFASDSGNIPSC